MMKCLPSSDVVGRVNHIKILGKITLKKKKIEERGSNSCEQQERLNPLPFCPIFQLCADHDIGYQPTNI